MTDPADQRRLLGAFIRSHRERLPASTNGRGRRRTAGLRREEVALLCGISVTWYTWIEQGRDISLSPASLSRLAVALRLTAAERAYAFDLARKRDPSPPRVQATSAASVPAVLMAALEAVAVPAYLLDRLWCARAWNRAAAELFEDWLGGGEPNLLRYVFLAPGVRGFIRDWEERGRRLAAEFRAATALAQDDPAIRALVMDLSRASPDFARFWDEQAVQGREGGSRVFDHPADGERRYTQVTLVPAGHPDHKIVMLMPDPAAAG